MEETINNGKKYVSLNNLTLYNDLLEGKIADADTTTLSSATSYSDKNLEIAKTYADDSVSQKSQVLMITWEDDD